jgi:Fe-S cluster assembly scaffold protein SufB
MTTSKSGPPDAQYLKQSLIGGIISKGMAITYQHQPKDPIDYFAKWLLAQSQIAKAEEAAVKKACRLEKVREDHEQQRAKTDKAAAERQAVETRKLAHFENFRELVRDSRDLEDELQQLVDHLKDSSEATAVYIGKVVTPIRPISEDAGENAHVDPEAVP